MLTFFFLLFFSYLTLDPRIHGQADGLLQVYGNKQASTTMNMSTLRNVLYTHTHTHIHLDEYPGLPTELRRYPVGG